MSNSPRPVSARCLAFAAALSFGLSNTISLAAETPPAGEAASAATQPPVETLVELDEVWVRGKSLTRLIEEAEDALFARYNQLNANDRFDVHCGDVALQRGSMIMTRTCLPGFIAGRVPASVFQPVRAIQTAGVYYQPPSFGSSPSVCHGPMVVQGGSAFFEGGCYGTPFSQGSYGGYGNAGFSYISNYYSPPLELEAVHYRQEYADTVIQVILGDPQLREMAGELAVLYADLELTQQRYRAVRSERYKGRPRSLGPRVPTPRRQ